MTYTCRVTETSPQTLAVTPELSVRVEDIPTVMRGQFDIVYGWIGHAEVERTGGNHAIYRVNGDELTMQVGFPVSTVFADTGNVECFALQSRKAVTARHTGSYDGLAKAYDALFSYCKEQGLHSAGFNWEEYGDWSDDPKKLVTDVYMKLAD